VTLFEQALFSLVIFKSLSLRFADRHACGPKFDSTALLHLKAMKSKVNFTKLQSLLTSFVLLSGLYTVSAEEVARPNILFIVSDDLRDSVGSYGNSVVKTPHLDKLSTRGVTFDRAYVQYPVCGPSRASLITGLRPEQTKIWDNRTFIRETLPEVVTIPEWLKNQGYYTASYGKVFHTLGGDEAKIAHWSDGSRSWNHLWEPPLRGDLHAYIRDPESKQRGEMPLIMEGRNLTAGKLKWCEWGATEGPDELEPDGQVVTAAINKIDELGQDPWFLAVGLYRPHDPFVAPKKYFDMYSPESLKIYHDASDMSPAPDLAIPPGEMRDIFQKISEQDQLEYLRAYYACTSFMDAQVGRLLNHLESKGLSENTLIFFVGDHGFHLGERKWWNKVTLFDRSCRVPLIVAGPKVDQGRKSQELIELIDLFPTFVDACGLELPKAQDFLGESFFSLLSDASAKGKKYAFTMTTRGPEHIRGVSIRDHRWRYTEWDEGRAGVELYDELADPEETKNLATLPEHASLIAEFKKSLKTLSK